MFSTDLVLNGSRGHLRICAGIGLPLDSATLKKTVNVDGADRVLVRLVATTINGESGCCACGLQPQALGLAARATVVLVELTYNLNHLKLARPICGQTLKCNCLRRRLCQAGERPVGDRQQHRLPGGHSGCRHCPLACWQGHQSAGLRRTSRGRHCPTQEWAPGW
jgi:hypothetical protein